MRSPRVHALRQQLPGTGLQLRFHLGVDEPIMPLAATAVATLVTVAAVAAAAAAVAAVAAEAAAAVFMGMPQRHLRRPCQ